MKKVLLPLLILFVVPGFSQTNNSWIDYNKTYYKFNVGSAGLYRLNQSALPAAIAGIPAEQFQLWRNGEQVRIYTSASTGALGAGGYIEFWGLMNDGKKDTKLYRVADHQLSDYYSLETDTSAYFLTVNPAGGNLRFTTTANNVSGTPLTPEAYFMNRAQVNYKDKINAGYAAVVGFYVYSSTYDIGEGYTSSDIAPGFDLSFVLENLNVYTAGPPASFKIAAVGNALNARNIRVKLWQTTIIDEPVNYFSYLKKQVDNIPLSAFANTAYTPIYVSNVSTTTTDRLLVSNYELRYPSTWNFNNKKNFQFELPATVAGNHLIIDNFNYGTTAPVLYDHNSGNRYVGDISTPGKVKFVLLPSADALRKFVLTSQDASNINSINIFKQRTFINYTLAANQGNYLLITNSQLFAGTRNYVEDYRAYRASAAGGSFNAQIYDIDQLTDQYAYGIKHHPFAIKDFIQHAKATYTSPMKNVLLLGKGVSYDEYRLNESSTVAEKLNLVPTYGYPATDISLVSNYNSFIPEVPVGRISAVNGTEISNYLEKLKQYDSEQASPTQTVAAKAWMKNVVHVAGGADSIESFLFESYLNSYRDILKDTFFGGKVETFIKSNTAAIQIISSQRIEQLFNEGISFLQYFGHSSANSLAFNLNDPQLYTNVRKYPFINVSGCTAGNIFTFDSTRLTGNLPSISEKYVLANQRGSIAFMASTHLGIPPFLNNYNYEFYRKFGIDEYGLSSGLQVKNLIASMAPDGFPLDYFTRMHVEEINLHGDPAVKINYFAKPDYVIEESMIKLDPNIISVADNSFKIDISMMNIGKAVNDSIRVVVQRKLPNDSIKTLFNQKIPAIKYKDSLQFTEFINQLTDKGLNKIIVTLDFDGKADELSESNNTITKEFHIFEDEVRPVYPYNYAIVSQQNVSYYASTANPLTGMRQIILEVDTTEAFNSSFKKIVNVNSIGGVIQFTPPIAYTDSTVYYWRVGMTPATGAMIWNSSSFVYITNSSKGFNQSHYYQHLKSSYLKMTYGVNRQFEFASQPVSINISTGNFPPNLVDKTFINAGPATISNWGNAFGTLQFVGLDPRTLEGFPNAHLGPGVGKYQSNTPGATSRQWQFEYPFSTLAGRNRAITLMDSVPNGHYVILYFFLNNNGVYSYVDDWKTDASINPGGFSLYNRLKAVGFSLLDSFTRNRPMLFMYKKGDPTFAPVQMIGTLAGDVLERSVIVPQTQTDGSITSPKFGPAKAWHSLHWRGKNVEPGVADSTSIEVYGIDNAGTSVFLAKVNPAQDSSLSWINASTYRYLQLKMNNKDKANATPHQLRYWMINADYVPEGAIAPNIAFSMKDTVDQGEKIEFKIAFKNISEVAFDSMKVKFNVTDRNNLTTPIQVAKKRVIASGDTLMVTYTFETRNLTGNNTLFLEFNPDLDQLEQYHFNNFIYKAFFVKSDDYNPLLDVTFDGVHILNRDIVSARPRILIKMKDESRFLALSDTALLKVQIRYPGPNGILRTFPFDNDTLRFTPANLSTGENTATIELSPKLAGNDDEYELIVSGKDVVGNKAGDLEYRVTFRVISKPMISNLLNYPNPFTSSTAFVFTITGTDVPQNLRIQILTVTGKVVREITKAELGALHVGRNITDFKWDGTDAYGQKLANGVYLYRVLTNHNGKSLDKYTAQDDDTDKYFTKGYGKMYLMR